MIFLARARLKDGTQIDAWEIDAIDLNHALLIASTEQMDGAVIFSIKPAPSKNPK